MPDDTTILSLPLILPAQAQKHVTHNEALVQLDLIVQLAVFSRGLTAAPALAAVGDRYIVAAGAVGDWVGQAGKIALFSETGWQFTQPLPGWQAHVLAEGQTAVFDGLVWETLSDGPLVVAQLGVSATPDGTNRVAVSSPATLLNHAGAGHQLKLNKATGGDTASLLFQTGFSGRAEMGTAGSDDFAVKVSADGTGWSVALEAEAGTGEVTLPKPVHLGGQASDPVSPADGTLWLNTTSGEVKLRSGGATQVLGNVGDGDKGDVTVTGGVWTIDAGAVTLGKLAPIATDSFLGRDTAGTGVPEVLSPAQATSLLDTFTSGAKGLVPASGGGTTKFLRADGSFAAPPGGGGAPGGASGEVQYNDSGALAGAADVEIEGGQLRLPLIATPTTPAAGGVKLYGSDFGPGTLAFLRPDGVERLLQSDLGHFNVNRWVAQVGLNAFTGEHSLNTTNIGTLTAATPAVTNLHRMMPRLDLLVTTATTSAIAGWRPNGAASRFLRVGKDANAPGGFLVRQMWGPATGVSTATSRGFCGVADWSAAPTDVEPSNRTNIAGMGWDAADTNLQFMHNDGAGTATKIDLGASFPVPTLDRTEVYEVQLYSPNSLTQSVSYRVIRYSTTDKTVAAEATGTVTTDLPAVTTLLGAVGAMSVGGTSSVVGVAVMGILTAREY